MRGIMPEQEFTGGAICNGNPALARRIGYCWTCERRRRIVVLVAEWYSNIYYCTGCGDNWSEGIRARRPFARNWKRDAIAKHKEMWTEAVSWKEAMDHLMRQVKASLEA